MSLLLLGRIVEEQNVELFIHKIVKQCSSGTFVSEKLFLLRNTPRIQE